MDFTTKEYWQQQYQSGKTGWNIGYISTPLKDYFDQLTDKNLKILIPGAGNAYEAEYLYHKGFYNVFVLDIASQPLQNFKQRFPDFPQEHLLETDFFTHHDTYDLIVEQTFFSAVIPENRHLYVQKTHELLKDNGKLIGLLFDKEFHNPFPPFGGNKTTYQKLFEKHFFLKVFETAHNSIKPRAHNELFIIFEKKIN